MEKPTQPWPDLKRPDKYGVYNWWPEEGVDWIHPYDLPKAKDHIPSNLVFRKSDHDEQYSLLSHGELKIRVKPTLWLPVKFEGLNVGDFVEVKSEFGKNEPMVAVIHQMTWDDHKQQIEYQLSKAGRLVPRVFACSSLVHVDRLNRLPVKPTVKIVREDAPIVLEDKAADSFLG